MQLHFPCEFLCFHCPFSSICCFVFVIPIFLFLFYFFLSSTPILHFPFLTATTLISICSSLCGLILNGRSSELSASWSKADTCQKHRIMQGSENKETQIKNEGSSKREGWILFLPDQSCFFLHLRNETALTNVRSTKICKQRHYLFYWNRKEESVFSLFSRDTQKLCKHRGTARHLQSFPKGIQSSLGVGVFLQIP